jgi:flagellar protein FliS
MTPRPNAQTDQPVMPSITLEKVIEELRQLGTSDRVAGLYELGIDGCANKNAAQVATVLGELLSSLDYEYADIAEGFRRVYEYCLQQAADRAFEGVSFILQDLRDTLLRAVTDAAADSTVRPA